MGGPSRPLCQASGTEQHRQGPCYDSVSRLAGVAQLVEQPIRNRQVIGSSPIAGSRFTRKSNNLREIDCLGVFALEQPIMTLDQAIQQFIDQGRYIRNWSPKTVRCYRQCPVIFQRSVTDFPTKTSLQAFIVQMRQEGRSAGGCKRLHEVANNGDPIVAPRVWPPGVTIQREPVLENAPP